MRFAVFARFLLVSALSMGLPPVTTQAAPPKEHLPNASGKIIRDFARITFEWPETVYLSAESSGKTVTIRFERPANPIMSGTISALSPYVQTSQLSPDGRTLTLTLDRPYRVRSFVSGNVSGVDILGVDKSTEEPAAQKASLPVSTPFGMASAPLPAPEFKPEPSKEAVKPAKVEQKKPAAKPAPQKERERAKVEAPQETVTTKESAKVMPEAPVEVPASAAAKPEQAAMLPSVTVNSTTEKPTQTAEVEEAPIPPLAPLPLDMPKIKEKAAEKPAKKPEEKSPAPPAEKPAEATKPEKQAEQIAEKSVEKPTNKALETPEEHTEVAASAEKQAQAVAGEGPPLKVAIANTADSVNLTFDWKSRTPAAAFIRGKTAWIIFGAPAHIDTSTFPQAAQPITGSPTTLPLKNATVLRLPVTDGAKIAAVKIANSYQWTVSLSAKSIPLKKPLVAQANVDLPPKPHVLVPASEMGEALTLTDPDTLDTLIVMPLFAGGQGIADARQFVEFSLPATGEGILIEARVDDLEVTKVRNGLRISTPAGLKLSPDLPAPAQKKNSDGADATASGTIFPYAEWAPAAGSKPGYSAAEEQQWLRDAGKAITADQKQANPFRLKLVKRYLAEGRAFEALGILRMIARADPAYYANERLSALEGAANFLSYRFGEAAQNFAAPELDSLPEINYWRAMLGELLGNPDKSFDYMANYEPYISKYPPLFKQRLAIIAADRAVGAGDPNNALKVLDTLHDNNLAEGIKDYVNYLMGNIAVSTGKTKDGIAIWQALLEGNASPSVKARAEFSLITQTLKKKTITEEEAIKRLQSLQLAWRNDNLELSVMGLLGDLYYKHGHYYDALRIWRNMNEAYANTIPAVEASHKMTDAFVALFDEGKADALPVFDQVALYYDFRDLTPATEVGDRITQKFVDRLIKLDLLEQASIMLEQRMLFRYEREERSSVGAKLAQLYLMDQKPKDALEALQKSVYGSNPPAIQKERDYLTAQTMMAQKNYKSALNVLSGDTTARGLQLRIDAHFAQKDWAGVIQDAEAMLKARKDPAAPIPTEQGETLVQLALAYRAEHDTVQLQYLRDYFTELMKGNPKEKTFAFVTQGDLIPTPENFADAMKPYDDIKPSLANFKTAPVAAPATVNP